MDIELQYRKVPNDEAELRYDILHDEWILIARSRGKRPDEFAGKAVSEEYDEETDLFRDPESTGQEPDTLIYRDDEGSWTTRVFPNKYPAVSSEAVPHDLSEGPYPAVAAAGVHEIVVTRDGRRIFPLLDIVELAEVIDAYQERYLAIMRERHIRSITIFHNHGKKAGGSIMHPHSQIIALPIVASTVARELEVAERYYVQNNLNLFGMLAAYEQESGERVIYENEAFIAYCPYSASRAFQIRILPKTPQPYFERITNNEKILLADAMKKSLWALYEGLENPDFNFYIRTAPCNGQDYNFYSYYVEIFPRTHVYAGFEFATDIEIVPISPEDAAGYLRAFI